MNKVIEKIIPLLVVGAGAGVAVAFVKTAPTTPKTKPEPEVTLVDVVTAERSQQAVNVRGLGTVVAARAVALKAEVAGRVVWVSPHLVEGGRVRSKDRLLKIDDRDYTLAVEERSANVQKAQFELAQEQGRRRVAEREWKLLGSSAPTTPEGRALALREPQLKSARAALAAAKSSLARAKLDVRRTRVNAPFNAFVQREDVEIGQLVDRQTSLATLIGSDEFWVQVSLPVADLRWVAVPGDGGRGSKTTIVQKLSGGQRVRREGRVLRLAGDLDPRGRMARLIVAVDDPMDGQDGQLPLLLGAYVEVEIEGRTLDDIVVLPRRAVHAGDAVWIMTEGGKLEIRKAAVIYRGHDDVYVQGGIEAGDRVVVSRIVTPIEGMALRVPEGVRAGAGARADEGE